MGSDLPAAPAISVRPAHPHERVALRAAAWRNLPKWVWEMETLRVAVTGRREMLLGCAWEISFAGTVHAGAAVSLESRLAAAAMETLIVSFHPHASEPMQWDEWVEVADPKLDWLQSAGFRIEERMMAYEISYSEAGAERLLRGYARAAARGLEPRFTWSGLDEAALPQVRAVTVREGLTTAGQFDFHYFRGELDLANSVVAWVDDRLAGFMVLTTFREEPEVLLMVVEPEFRSSGLGALMIREMFLRKSIFTPEQVQKVVFCGNPEKNPGSRHLCLRFGGIERQARVRMILPPLSSPS